jgi:hypothetical protein
MCYLQPAGRGSMVVKNLVDVLSARSRATPGLWGSKAAYVYLLSTGYLGLTPTCR